MKRVSQFIGWSEEAKLYYEWLLQLERLTAPCPTTTTTTTISGDNLTLKITNTSGFEILPSSSGEGDFTIEWFAKMTRDDNHPRSWSIGSWPDAAHAVSIENGLIYYWIGGSIIMQGNLIPFIGIWTHFCIMRSGNTIYLYENGQLLNTTGFTGDIPIKGKPLYLGSEGNDSVANGLMSNFRWNSTAVYNPGGFLYPAVPLTSIFGTKLLIFQGNTLPLEITDNSGMISSGDIVNGTGIYNSDNPFTEGSIQFGTV
jgi:hypothetical protein